MKNETQTWLRYADENLESAKLLFENELYNPCLQNVQQSVEKNLKALLIEFSLEFKRTHSIQQLSIILKNADISISLTDDDVDFLDSIYLPTKYPIGSALPDFHPTEDDCRLGLQMAEKVLAAVRELLDSNS